MQIENGTCVRRPAWFPSSCPHSPPYTRISTGVLHTMTRFLSALLLLTPLARSRPKTRRRSILTTSRRSRWRSSRPPTSRASGSCSSPGRQSHGPGDHEFFAGSAILMNLLKQTPGVWPIMARDGWPKNEKLFDTADCIVMYMDGGGGHPVDQARAHGRSSRSSSTAGAGWVNIHYAVEYPVKQATATSPVREGLARRLLRDRLLDQPALGRGDPQRCRSTRSRAA